MGRKNENESKVNTDLVAVLKEKTKEGQLNQVELYPYIPEWKREEFKSFKDYKRLKKRRR
ncbi:hypothetical protein CN356_31500 [Bacillus cereus]|nr:hypothetical protein CN356_31500 [Bacillus cereus]